MTVAFSPMIGLGKDYNIAASTLAQYLDANPNRAFLMIQNQGANPLYIYFGSPFATPGSVAFTLAAGATFAPQIVMGDAIWLSSGASATTVAIWQA